MDQDRLRWITKPPTLDHWSLNVRFAETPTGTLATVYAEGRCDRKRSSLWYHHETIPVEHGRYSLHDLITHLSMVVAQDRPTTNQALTRGMMGAAWEQPELPF